MGRSKAMTEALRELEAASLGCSNVCYNLGQQDLPNGWADSCKSAAKRYDSARRFVREVAEQERLARTSGKGE